MTDPQGKSDQEQGERYMSPDEWNAHRERLQAATKRAIEASSHQPAQPVPQPEAQTWRARAGYIVEHYNPGVPMNTMGDWNFAFYADKGGNWGVVAANILNALAADNAALRKRVDKVERQNLDLYVQRNEAREQLQQAEAYKALADEMALWHRGVVPRAEMPLGWSTATWLARYDALKTPEGGMG